MGWLSHREALEQFAWAEAFVFSSLRDTTGTVVLEALGAGVPVICLDHQGVHDLVTDECGLKIAVTSPRDVVARLSEAIGRLAGDHQQWARLSRGAIERARDYLWSRREGEMAEWYRRVIEGSLHGKAQPLPSMDFELRRPEAHRLQSAGLARATSTHTTAK
jgi:glycosyltransferase involved in cell wall biosynthesis